MIGIYKITNLISGKSYIGQSVNIERRWKDEKNAAFCNTNHSYNYPLSKALRKYGLENFSFEIIEECKKEELNEKEKYWISKYNTFYQGYNQTLGGDSAVNKLKDNIIGIINDLENTDLYHKEIAKKWNVSIETVQGINTGHYWYQENKKYPLQTKHKIGSQHKTENGVENKTKYFCEVCKTPITRGAKYCVSCAQLKSRKVERPGAEELYNYLVSIKGNFTEAARHFGVTDNAVRKWCKYYNIPHLSKDYKKEILL